ncbi:2OG-Fe(II) oxygenase [Streptomyces sp. G-G2]|uniref:2OG-Fe(II) oxygenase n=1 Tax=Streptomyces sp. G-G2 TaxID=3046201 RepID=UPI0024BAF72B|nr:2OG-Fe(II) oxygenase [Streptomyces sp. G-G2]MDJ0386085.1 2OG-Fe(II) oxygenase [Streptomyces sp. G-G2]
MRVTYSDSTCLVVDDFLDQDAFGGLSKSVQYINYSSIHDSGWNKPYGPPGLPIIQSAGVLRGEKETTPPGLKPIGSFVEDLRNAQTPLSDGPGSGVVGSRILTGKVVAMGAGAGLFWHADTDQVSGAYIFYLHPRWDSSWGGELMVMDGKSQLGVSTQARAALSDSGRPDYEAVGAVIGPDFRADPAEERRMHIGSGRFYAARPNRLVILSGQVEHRVNPVLPAAGDNFRCSVVGFAIK